MSKIQNKKLARRILVMAEEDQHIRKWVFCESNKDDKERNIKIAKLKEIDSLHTLKMKKIIKKHGWPGKDLVGEKASHMSWLLVQHADLSPSFQRKCLKLMQDAVRDGKAKKQDVAYLTDRVLVHQEKKQIYGTQLQGDKNGRYSPFPIANPKN